MCILYKGDQRPLALWRSTPEINVFITSNAKRDVNARTGYVIQMTTYRVCNVRRRGPAQCIEIPSLSRHPIPDFVEIHGLVPGSECSDGMEVVVT